MDEDESGAVLFESPREACERLRGRDARGWPACALAFTGHCSVCGWAHGLDPRFAEGAEA